MQVKLRLPTAIVAAVVVVLALLAPSAVAQKGPFQWGVAAYATHNSATLWTKTIDPARVSFQVATDAKFNDVVARGNRQTAAEHDMVAEPTVRGLDPSTKYFYRFSTGNASTRGKFRTMPSPNRHPAFDFSVTGDSDFYWLQHPEEISEPFDVLRRIKETNPDFWIYLGDTIYSDSEAAEEQGVPTALTLEEKWQKYKDNRVPAAKALFKSVSTWAQWDDHEVINDYDGAVLAQTDPALLAAGQQAFFDYFPGPTSADETYMKIDVGSDADFLMLDERTFRTQSADGENSPCLDAEGNLDLAPTLPEYHRAVLLQQGPVDPACLAHVNDPNRTMLGAEQKQWLKDSLLESDAKWKFIVNEVPMTQLWVLPYDRWEGYAAERAEILNFIRDNNVKNVVFLTTDIHANWGAGLHVNIDADREHPVAYEVTSGPIQTCYLECEFDRIAGEGATDQFFGYLNFQKLVVFDCVNYDSYAYSTVSVPADTARLRMQWRDNHKASGGGGKPLEGCNLTLDEGTYPVTE